MPTNDNMTAPLTRRDLEEVLDQRLADHPTHAQLEEVLDRRLADHPTHAQLEEVLDRRFADHPTHAQLADQLAQLRTEIASDTRTTMTVLLEDAFKRFRVIDDSKTRCFHRQPADAGDDPVSD